MLIRTGASYVNQTTLPINHVIYPHPIRAQLKGQGSGSLDTLLIRKDGCVCCPIINELNELSNLEI